MKPTLIGENSGCQYSEKSKPNQTNNKQSGYMVSAK